jgi:hypothetical protein
MSNLKYSYKLIQGQGYVGLVNGKRFTGVYDERDLGELKAELQKLQKLDDESSQVQTQKRETENNKSFREWMRECNPKFTQAYEDFLAKNLNK